MLSVIAAQKQQTHKCTPNLKSLTQENTREEYRLLMNFSHRIFCSQKLGNTGT